MHWISSRQATNWVKLLWQNSCFEVYGAKRPQNVQQMRFSKFYGECKHDMFIIFCTKLQYHKGLNFLKPFFWGKGGRVLGFFGPKPTVVSWNYIFSSFISVELCNAMTPIMKIVEQNFFGKTIGVQIICCTVARASSNGLNEKHFDYLNCWSMFYFFLRCISVKFHPKLFKVTDLLLQTGPGSFW